MQLMTYLPGESAVRPSADEASCFTTGAFAHGGGIAGLSLRQNVTLFPIVTSVLCRFIRRVLPAQVYRYNVGEEPDHPYASRLL